MPQPIAWKTKQTTAQLHQQGKLLQASSLKQPQQPSLNTTAADEHPHLDAAVACHARPGNTLSPELEQRLICCDHITLLSIHLINKALPVCLDGVAHLHRLDHHQVIT
jgi:hypothetical protein